MPNILQNGDFIYPNILSFLNESGDVQYYKDFIQVEKDIFVWIGSDDGLSVQNNDNDITSFGYPDIFMLNVQGASGLNIYQYISCENTASLQQTINITKIGMYDLGFLYVSRPNYSLNNLQIFFDNF